MSIEDKIPKVPQQSPEAVRVEIDKFKNGVLGRDYLVVQDGKLKCVSGVGKTVLEDVGKFCNERNLTKEYDEIRTKYFKHIQKNAREILGGQDKPLQITQKVVDKFNKLINSIDPSLYDTVYTLSDIPVEERRTRYLKLSDTPSNKGSAANLSISNTPSFTGRMSYQATIDLKRFGDILLTRAYEQKNYNAALQAFVDWPYSFKQRNCEEFCKNLKAIQTLSAPQKEAVKKILEEFIQNDDKENVVRVFDALANDEAFRSIAEKAREKGFISQEQLAKKFGQI